jgi:hypothetical protein
MEKIAVLLVDKKVMYPLGSTCRQMAGSGVIALANPTPRLNISQLLKPDVDFGHQ